MKNDYIGKFLLRDGDLLPEEINEQLIKSRKYTKRFFVYLDKQGLLFDNKNDAKIASRNARFLCSGIRDHRFTSEPESSNKGRIYISGPISGHDINERREKFKETQVFLEHIGWETFNPMENGLPEYSKTANHMRRDLSVLCREEKPFDAIYMMEGWNHSAGCWTEFHDALAIGLGVIFEQSGVLLHFD